MNKNEEYRDYDSGVMLTVNVTYYDQLYDMLDSQDIVIPVLCAAIILVGLVGNILVIVCVMHSSDMRNSTNLLIANMAMADILFNLFCVLPDAARYYLWYWPFGSGMCKVTYFFASVTLYMRIYTLLLLSLERILTLMHPDVNRRAMYLIIEGVLWMVLCLNSLFGPIVSVVVKVFYPWDNNYHEWCVLMHDTFNEFWWGMFIFSFFLPLFGVYSVFVVIIYRYCFGYSLGRSLQDLPEAKPTTIVVFTVAFLCTACWLPLYTIMLGQTGDPSHIRFHLDIIVETGSKTAVSYLFGYIDMCINPIVYFLLLPSFKNELASTVNLQCCSKVRRRQKDEENIERSSLNRVTIEL